MKINIDVDEYEGWDGKSRVYVSVYLEGTAANAHFHGTEFELVMKKDGKNVVEDDESSCLIVESGEEVPLD